MKVGDKVTCAGEAQDVFEITKLGEFPDGKPVAMLQKPDGYLHGWERVEKLTPYDPESEATVLYAAWRIENHNDREMTFLGVFESEALANVACDKHCASHHFHRRYEYSVRECVLNRSEE